MKSIIRDLVYRIEGYSDDPDYIINSISICGNIEIVCREKPKAETQAEPQGAKDESDK